jgi:flagellar biosynthesis protein FlhA
VDPIEIELGFNLVSLASGGDLLDKITRARQAIADELGLVLPKVRVRDNLSLNPNHFQVRINQLPVGQVEVHPDQVLLIRKSPVTGEPDGIAAEWHTGFGAWWVSGSSASARSREFLRLDAADVIVETLKQHARLRAAQILTRQSTAWLIEQLRETSPATVSELIPDVLKIGGVQQVLQALLAEGISIKPLGTILEALADHYQPGRTAAALADDVRRQLATWITDSLRDEHGQVRVIALDNDLEMWIGGRAVIDAGQRRLAIDHHTLQRIRQMLLDRLPAGAPGSRPVGLLVSPALRAPLRQALDLPWSLVRVTTREELARDAKIETIAILSLRDVQYVAA